LAVAGLEAALRFYDAVSLTLGELALMPLMGEQRDSADPRLAGLRVWRVGGFPNHLIFYRVDDGVEVVRILHGVRDIDRIFGTEA
jgi:toxin ParE1/3/4